MNERDKLNRKFLDLLRSLFDVHFIKFHNFVL